MERDGLTIRQDRRGRDQNDVCREGGKRDPSSRGFRREEWSTERMSVPGKLGPFR